LVVVTQFAKLETISRLARRSARPAHILIACMPKSGSTFLSDVISQLPGFQRALLYPASDRREQELDEYCLREVDAHDYVAQSHCRHSEWTDEMRRTYGLKPVVLVRSLLDVIVSLRDHVRKQSPIWPMFYAEPAHADLDDARLELMLARLATPWYVNFYMGWRQARGALMVSYEQLIRAPTQTVSEIVAFSGAVCSEAEVAEAVERVCGVGRSRLNVGVAGRGASLRPETIRAVLELLDFYPDAADDPYIQAVRAQGQAALTGQNERAAWPSSVAVSRAAPPPPRLAPARYWIRKKAKHLIVARVTPVVLVLAGLLYWRWPNDLIQDTLPYGRIDDVLILLVTSFLAGRLAYQGARQRLRPARR